MKLSLTGMDRDDPGSEGGYDPARRAAGFDWPATEVTMIGLRRLSSLQEQVETVGGFLPPWASRHRLTVLVDGVRPDVAVRDRAHHATDVRCLEDIGGGDRARHDRVERRVLRRREPGEQALHVLQRGVQRRVDRLLWLAHDLRTFSELVTSSM